MMSSASFDQLVTSRKEWIENVLRPWCQSADLKSLIRAEVEWVDIAGKVAPEMTLWRWAWSRFPDLVHESLGIEETVEVVVTLADGRVFRGFPDARSSQKGKLVLLGRNNSNSDHHPIGPFSIDQVVAVTKGTEPKGRDSSAV